MKTIWLHKMLRHILKILVLVLSIFFVQACAPATSTSPEKSSSQGTRLEDRGEYLCQQFPSGLMLYHKKSKIFSSWEEADQYAKSLEVGGFSDWRLPTKNECYQLVMLLEIKKHESCGLKKLKGHYWIQDQADKAGQWEDVMLCGGNEFYWVDSERGRAWAVRP